MPDSAESYTAGHEELDILFQDEHLIAVNKPSGLLVHRSEIDRYETRFALQLVRDYLGEHVYPLHRLDKPTSGVLIFGRSPEIAKRMMPLFANQQVTKTYLAVVRGYTDLHGVIDTPLAEEWDKMTDARARRDKAPQSAITTFKQLGTVELPFAVGRYPSCRYSLLHVTPQTGRKHQIRRHLKRIYHPVIGDTTHGDGKHNQFFRQHYHVERLLLHLVSMGFTHPVDNTHCTISAALDRTFQFIINEIDWATG